MSELLPTRSVEDVLRQQRRPFDEDTLQAVRPIVAEVLDGGEAALRRWAARFEELGTELFFEPSALRAAFESIDAEDRALLERMAGRIRVFAEAQRAAVHDVDVAVPGGRAGHVWMPVERAGCYAPGGRYPLPSSVLMTVIPAHVAGVVDVWVATPKPSLLMIAAAHVAGAAGVLAVGGAQAIAAFTRGVGPIAPRDMIVGPGNAYVTAAKYLVSDRVGIDGLAGPSELVVLADGDASPDLIAADLLAQAEHDPLALPILVTSDAGLVDAVRGALDEQLTSLSTAETARGAVEHGVAIVVTDLEAGAAACNALSPEHLQVFVASAENVVPNLRTYGALFVGKRSAEVLGDYGAGPNHVLPTGGTARYAGGLSVFTYLVARTWLSVGDGDKAQPLIHDAIRFGRLEGLEAHARAAERR